VYTAPPDEEGSISIEIAAPKGAPAWITLDVRSQDAEQRLIAQAKVIVSFVPGRKASLRLSSVPCEMFCPQGQGCGESGACEKTPVRKAKAEE
jgi:hypothetical protein